MSRKSNEPRPIDLGRATKQTKGNLGPGPDAIGLVKQTGLTAD